MFLIVLEVVLLVLAVLFLLNGAGNKRNSFDRASDYAVGISLLILLTSILYLWR